MAGYSKIEAVFLDVAGTVIDFGSVAPVGIFQEVFRNHGVEVTAAEVRVPMGTQKREHIRQMLYDQPEIAKRWLKSHDNIPFSDKDIDTMYAEMGPASLKVLPLYAKPIDGCISALQEIQYRFNVKLALTTGYSRSMLECNLKQSELDYQFLSSTWIANTVAADEVKLGRPAPYMLHRLMEQFEIINPKNCLVVGDTIPDIEAAKNAGMLFAAVIGTGNFIGCSQEEFEKLPVDEKETRLNFAREEFSKAGADFIINSVADLPDIIESINDGPWN